MRSKCDCTARDIDSRRCCKTWRTLEMIERRLAQLLRDADTSDSAVRVREAPVIATNARAIGKSRQQRARAIIGATSVLVIVASLASLIDWRSAGAGDLAMRTEVDALDNEASTRLHAMQSIGRSKRSKQASRPAMRAIPHDVGVELDVERERAAAIILQSADQLREAGRSDYANHRYNDLVNLFPDTAAAQFARERIEQVKNRT